MSERSRTSWQMSLPLPFLLALRYLKSGRKDAYVSFLSLLATGGITLGVAALILVLGGLSGLQDFLRSDVLARTPHVEVELPPDADAAAARAALAEIDGVVEAQRILRGRGWLLSAGSAVSVDVVGYEGRLPRSFPIVGVPAAGSPAAGSPAAGSPAAGSPAAESPDAGPSATQEGLYVGDHLARRWALEAGDQVEVASPRPTLTPFGPQPRLHQQTVAGVFQTGRTEDDRERVALPLDVARRLFGEPAGRLEIRTAGLDEALEVAGRIAAAAPEGSRVRTWQELNRALFFALKLEKMLMFAAVFLIVPVAAMSLITVLALLISSKRAEIGMLQAMGARPRVLRRAFLVLGGLLGTLGLALGGTLGIGGAFILDRYRLISPPGDVYFVDHIPFRVEPGDLLAILGATVVLIVGSTLYAARRAAALGPVEALRA